MNELQTLLDKLNEGEGIERFSRRCEREIFRQWLDKFQANLPTISVPEPVEEEMSHDTETPTNLHLEDVKIDEVLDGEE